MKEFRIDGIRLPKVTYTKEGYIKGNVVASRAGIFKYLNSDGSIRKELRHPEEVFKTDSLDTLKMIPVTLDHPNEFVDAKNAHKFTVGFVGEEYSVQDDEIIVPIVITHKDAIDQIKNGKKCELSLGYETRLVSENGSYNDQKYDCKQTQIKYNHLAIVDQARAGRNARFRFDSCGELYQKACILLNEDSTVEEETNINNNSNKMDNNSTTELQLKFDAVNSENKALGAKIQLLENDKAELLKKIDNLEKGLDARNAEINQFKQDSSFDAINKKAHERCKLMRIAEHFIKDIEPYAYHTDREIMEIVINSQRTDKADFKDKEDSYVKGLFDAFVDTRMPRHLREDSHNRVFDVVSKKYDMSQSVSINDALMAAATKSKKK